MVEDIAPMLGEEVSGVRCTGACAPGQRQVGIHTGSGGLEQGYGGRCWSFWRVILWWRDNTFILEWDSPSTACVQSSKPPPSDLMQSFPCRISPFYIART